MKKHLLKIILSILVVTLIAPKTFSQNTNKVKKHNIFGIGKDSVIIALEEDDPRILKKATFSADYRAYITKVLTKLMDKLGNDKANRGTHFVKIEFVVCKDGSICNLELYLENKNELINKEALIAINKYKKWQPAIDKSNNKIDSYLIQTISVQIM